MIKESIVELISAIADGNTLAIEDSFNAVMASKISDRLDSMRVDVAQGMFGSVDESYDIEDYSVEELEDFMMSEEFEQLDELSRKTLGSYVKKATTNAIISGEALGKGEKWSKSGQIASKREKGIGKAVDKITKEEVEELDELSKKTLGSYVNKAHDQLMKHTASVNFKSGRGDSDALSYTHEPRTARKTANRTKGVATAIGKLTKEEFTLEDYSVEELEDFMMSEEFEQLDELSKKTLGSYVKKATSDVGLAGFVKGTTVNDHSRSKDYEDAAAMNKKRKVGIAKAVDKLTKENCKD
jgi:hypothetical protein